jgi:hypothetical protein
VIMPDVQSRRCKRVYRGQPFRELSDFLGRSTPMSSKEQVCSGEKDACNRQRFQDVSRKSVPEALPVKPILV